MGSSYTITVNALYTALFIVAALVAGLLLAALKRKRAMAWMIGALALAALQIWTFGNPRGHPWDFLATLILVPAAFFAMAQALRYTLMQGEGFWTLRSVALGLVSASGGAVALGFPHYPALAAFGLALSAFYFEIVIRLFRVTRPTAFHRTLLLIAAALLVAELARLVLTPLLFGLDLSIHELHRSQLNRLSLVVIGGLELLFVATLLAKIVANALLSMRNRAERDYLTGLFNRGIFEERLAAAVVGDGGALLIADLDRFKQVNDRYGHVMGDGAICVFASLLEKNRGLAGRIGGEEFAILLPRANAQDARAFAENLRGNYAKACAESLEVEEPLTVSIGCATFAAGESPALIFEHADKALYEAKRGGRNRVVLADGPSVPNVVPVR